MRATIEHRAVTGGYEVNFDQRIIELVAMPYDQEAAVIVHGRPVVETCLRGAFDGVEQRANRVKVNRDHNYQRTIGRAMALHPSREEGLVAHLRIARTDLGNETLELAADQSLDASCGFAVMPGGEEWLEHRSKRRLHRCFLDHIAMVPEGAYEGAQVLSVRSADQRGEPIETPKLDEVLAWLRANA